MNLDKSKMIKTSVLLALFAGFAITGICEEPVSAPAAPAAPRAEVASTQKHWGLLVQGLIPRIEHYSTDASGANSLTFAPIPMVGALWQNEDWIVKYVGSPLNYAEVPEYYTKRSYVVNVAMLEPLWSSQYKLGGGIWWDRVTGPGGTVTMNNGTGTADYAIPKRTASLVEYFLSLGVRAPKWKEGLNFDFDMLIKTPFSTRRNFGASLEVSYAIF